MADNSFPSGQQAPSNDPKASIARITDVLDRYIERRGVDGVVVSIHDTVTSLLTCILAVRALGPGRVIGVIDADRPSLDAQPDSLERFADHLGVAHRTVPVRDEQARFESELAPHLSFRYTSTAVETAGERMGTVCTYYIAETLRHGVLGTCDRTDLLLGTTPIFGRGWGEIFPFSPYYKSAVRDLVEYVDVSPEVRTIVDRTGTNERSTAADRPDRDRRDEILRKLVDEDLGIDQTASDLDVNIDVVRRYATRIVESTWAGNPAIDPIGARSDRAPPFHELELQFY